MSTVPKQIPHITFEQANAIHKTPLHCVAKEKICEWQQIVNSLIDKANAGQKQSEEQYITATQARELGVENAEYSDTRGKWHLCGNYCKYQKTSAFDGSDWQFVMDDKTRCVKLIEEVYDLLAEGESKTAKELIQKRVNNLTVNIPPYIGPVAPTCQVRDLNTGVTKTMTPEAAKLLQAETKDVCDWFDVGGGKSETYNFHFGQDGIYTYKLKANLVKLDGKLMAREAAIAEWESKKDTCDVWYTSDSPPKGEWELERNFSGKYSHNWNSLTQIKGAEYQLRPKPLKQEWAGSREDVIALVKDMLLTGRYL